MAAAKWSPQLILAVIVTLNVLLVGSIDVALAHKGKLPNDALSLVRQAAALLAQDPGMLAEVRERIDAALKATDVRGVDLARVRQARDALAAGDIPAARRALAEAVIPAASTPPAPPTQPVTPPQPGTTPGTPPIGPLAPGPGAAQEQRAPAPDAMAAMKMAEPLAARYGGTPTEVITVLAGLALIAVGLVGLRRGG